MMGVTPPAQGTFNPPRASATDEDEALFAEDRKLRHQALEQDTESSEGMMIALERSKTEDARATRAELRA
jgi:hypothetical protein